MNKHLKVALISGASGGIGAEVAIGLASDGYKLALVARSKDRLETLAQQIMKMHHTENVPLVLPADLTDAQWVQRGVAEVIERYGRIDLLFNAVGIYRTGNWEIKPNDFDEQLSINVKTVFNLVRVVVPHMIRQGSGQIITVASRRGKIAAAEEGAYSASKHAVVGLNNALYQELVPKGIKVTAICPGWVHTPMVKDSAFPKEEMIRTSDILETVRYITKLSCAASVKEIVIEPQSNLS